MSTNQLNEGSTKVKLVVVLSPLNRYIEVLYNTLYIRFRYAIYTLHICYIYIVECLLLYTLPDLNRKIARVKEVSYKMGIIITP